MWVICDFEHGSVPAFALIGFDGLADIHLARRKRKLYQMMQNLKSLPSGYAKVRTPLSGAAHYSFGMLVKHTVRDLVAIRKVDPNAVPGRGRGSCLLQIVVRVDPRELDRVDEGM